MPPISTNTPIRLGLVLTGLGLLCSTVFWAGTFVTETRFQKKIIEERFTRIEDGVESLSELPTALRNLTAAVNRIQEHLDLVVTRSEIDRLVTQMQMDNPSLKIPKLDRK